MNDHRPRCHSCDGDEFSVSVRRLRRRRMNPHRIPRQRPSLRLRGGASPTVMAIVIALFSVLQLAVAFTPTPFTQKLTSRSSYYENVHILGAAKKRIPGGKSRNARDAGGAFRKNTSANRSHYHHQNRNQTSRHYSPIDTIDQQSLDTSLENNGNLLRCQNSSTEIKNGKSDDLGDANNIKLKLKKGERSNGKTHNGIQHNGRRKNAPSLNSNAQGKATAKTRLKDDTTILTRPSFVSPTSTSAINNISNKTDILRNYDSLYCECDNNTELETKRMNDTIDELFTSLLFKVASYQPQAIIAPCLATSTNKNNATTTANESSLDPSIRETPILRQAYQYARSAHEGQCRKSGEPYITHPLGVAHIIADMKLDLPSLLTALLHDTVEDTYVTLPDVSKLFGTEIAQLVDGVTKVGKIPLSSVEEQQSENYRKLILSMSKDIRVLLVKLADRAHNMRTLQYMSPEKQRRIAKETMDIYVPLAHRLGIHWLKTELEDNCFRYISPEKYETLDELVRGSEEERRKYEEAVVEMLTKQMVEAGVGQHPSSAGNVNGNNGTLIITGRTKGLYSIHTKMRRQDIEFDDVHDVMAFRIIVDDVASCYQALGVVHSHFKPVPGKIKDYIALPKPNGYRSLHTTIIGPKGKLEVQIRTSDMHEVAESGIAAHWIYKQGGGGGDNVVGGNPKEGARYEWLRELVQEVRRQSDPMEFVKSVKEDLGTGKEVFVFSPKGDLYALARGSSVLDFAFKVHSQLGSHCVGAKVNGKQVTLRHLIKNGDTVEILTSNHQTPKREWLKYVRTSKAKNRIRSWLKRRQRERSVFAGKKMIEQGLKEYNTRGEDSARKEYQRKMGHLLTTFKLKDEDRLLMALGYGQITLESVMIEIFGAAAVKTQGKANKREKDDQFVLLAKRSIYPDASHQPSSNLNGIVVGQERNIMLKFCKNCNPLKGEKIRGVVTQGKGVNIHRLGCKYLLEADDERIVDVQWDDDEANVRLRPVRLHVLCEDTPGVLADMSRAISSLGINIGNVNLRRLPNGRGLAKLEVMLGKLEDLDRVMSHLRKEEGILSVSRR
mmetsp:Transcript_30039/g.63337  ORF Transcript_30039/g.63337 Transcript_30039/m.63337 type:complete len:1062 (-) Transcript_30039:719-3904(-)